MAWTSISNALVAVGAKPFATTIQALRDNFAGMAAGDPGAPKIVGEALNVLLSPITTTSAAYGGWTNLDRGVWIEINGILITGAAASNIQARLSSNNGSTWSAATSLSLINFTGSSASDGTDFRLLINIKTGEFRHVMRVSTLAAGWPHRYNSGTLAFAGSPNALELRGDNGVLRFDGKILVGVTP